MSKVRIRMPGYDSYAINYMSRRGIDILNVEQRKDGNVYTIWMDDVEKFDEKVYEIVNYLGIKRVLLTIFQNRHFLFAILCSMIIMVFLSHCVFEVEVIHANKDVRVLIEDELYDHGVRPFMIKKSFEELQEIKKTIKNEYPEEIEWLEINDDGMKYTVRVEERIITRKENEPEYCNVVSTKDAIVLGSVAKKGQVKVQTNDFVKKDDVLISGEITFNDKTMSHVCADGEVFGNTWYKVAISVPLLHTSKEFTGARKGNLGWEFGSTYNRIFKVHYDEYDVKKVKLFSIGKFALYKEEVAEYVSKEMEYTEEEAMEEALKQAREKLSVKLDEHSKILSEKVLQSSSYDSIISVEIFYSVKEIIGTKVEEIIIAEDEKVSPE